MGVAPRSWSANLNYCTPCAYAFVRLGVIASGPGGVVLGGSLVFPCFSAHPSLWGVGAGAQGPVED